MILTSHEDASVNFVYEIEGGKVECRYVRRNAEKVNCYLSSQTGCRQACRMCFLTQTGQTTANDVPWYDYQNQAKMVLDYYKEQIPTAGKAYKVNYDFMAQGDVFANKKFLFAPWYTLHRLDDLARSYDLVPCFKLSTIFPEEMPDIDLAKEFRSISPDIYYSLYSLNAAFRKRWLPKAMAPMRAAKMLKKYQDTTNKIITLHWAFIEGQNDSADDIEKIAQWIILHRLRVNFNIVRYNPFSNKFGKETSEEIIEARTRELYRLFPESRVKVVQRVGFDVAASCGMFVK